MYPHARVRYEPPQTDRQTGSHSHDTSPGPCHRCLIGFGSLCTDRSGQVVGPAWASPTRRRRWLAGMLAYYYPRSHLQPGFGPPRGALAIAFPVLVVRTRGTCQLSSSRSGMLPPATLPARCGRDWTAGRVLSGRAGGHIRVPVPVPAAVPVLVPVPVPAPLGRGVFQAVIIVATFKPRVRSR